MEDLHKIWPHRWISPKVKPLKSSIHGRGIAAKEKICKGEVIALLGGVIVPVKDIEQYRKKMGHVGIQIDDAFFICPTSKQELEEQGVCNHSCNPNIGCVGSLKFVALRDVNPEEELTFDYATTESHFESPFKCNCGAMNCRKIIRPTDWQNTEIQKKYGDYFSAYLKAKLTTKTSSNQH